MEWAMKNSVEEIVLAVGDALVSPGLGHAELILAALVGLAFVWGVIRSLFGDDEESDPTWRGRRS
jgi:hypothetical protein